MKILKKIYVSIVILTATTFLSCEKSPDENVKYPISFGSNLIVDTKASSIINTTADLRNRNQIFVYGKRGTSLIFNDSQITYDSSTSKWLPSLTQSWALDTYTFWGWTYSPAAAATNTADNGSVSVSNNGTTFTVNQPSSYIEDKMVDMLLSYKINISSAQSANRPLIDLQMEHALPMIDIYVIKSSGIESAIVDEITLSNIYRSATYTLNTHHVKGTTTENNNVWQVNFTTSSTQNAVYQLSDSFNSATATGGYQVAVDEADTEAAMHIMTVEQPIGSATTLHVHYWVNEKIEDGIDNYVEHDATFQLSNPSYGLLRWKNGNRTIYRITIDTGIHLSAQIKEWTHIDYIEGTLIP